MRAVRRAWRSLRLSWRVGLRHLPFFTQRTAVLLLGVLVATRERRPGIDVASGSAAASAGPPHARRAYPAGVLAMLGGVVTLVGWPGADGPTHLVPGERADQAPESRPAPGSAAPGAPPGAGDRSGADAGGAAAASPSPADPARPVPAGGAGADRAASQPGGEATGARGSGGAAGAGAGGPPAAPPTTTPPTTTTTGGPLDPVDDLIGPVVSTLLP
jgi:hypothetical protein